MGGIIFTSGQASLKHYKKIKSSFMQLKKLPNSYEHINPAYQVLKLGRMYDQHDYNFYKSSDIVVCAVGTIYYKESGPKDSISQVAKDFIKGSTIANIAESCDGHFCIIILSKKNSKAYVITDPCGSLHLYLYRNDHLFALSSSMLALAKHFDVTPNSNSIQHFIGIGHCLGGASLFNEIEILSPASIYSIDLNTYQVNKAIYWHPPKNSNYDLTFEEAAEKIKTILETILTQIPNEQAVYDFTGGYDSRLVLALAYGISNATDSLSAFFFGPRESREARIVEENCRNLGLKYINYELPSNWKDNFFDYTIRSHRLCDGMINACNYAPVLWATENKRKHFFYSLNGNAGELYMQEEWQYDLGRRGQKRPANLKRKIKMDLFGFGADFTFSIFSDVFKKSMLKLPSEILAIYRATNKTLAPDAPNTLQYDNLFFQQRLRYGLGMIPISNQIIQVLSPLWFKKPLEISLSLPYYYKLRSKLTRHIAERASLKFANQKMINNTPFVTMRLTNLYRFLPGLIFVLMKLIRKASQMLLKKTIWSGLTTPDYDSSVWFQKVLADPRCRSLLNYEEMITSPLYEKAQFDEFIKRAREDDGFHYYNQLGNIITLELTMRYAGIHTSSLNLE